MHSSAVPTQRTARKELAVTLNSTCTLRICLGFMVRQTWATSLAGICAHLYRLNLALQVGGQADRQTERAGRRAERREKKRKKDMQISRGSPALCTFPLHCLPLFPGGLLDLWRACVYDAGR